MSGINSCCGGTGTHGLGSGEEYCDDCEAEFTAFSSPTKPGWRVSVEDLVRKRIALSDDLAALREENERLEAALRGLSAAGLACAADLVRLPWVDEAPQDSVDRECVVNIALELRNACDVANAALAERGTLPPEQRPVTAPAETQPGTKPDEAE